MSVHVQYLSAGGWWKGLGLLLALEPHRALKRMRSRLNRSNGLDHVHLQLDDKLLVSQKVHLQSGLEFTRRADPGIVRAKDDALAVRKLQNVSLAVIQDPIKIHGVNVLGLDVHQRVVNLFEKEAVDFGLEWQEQRAVEVKTVWDLAKRSLGIHVAKTIRCHVIEEFLVRHVETAKSV